MKHIALATNPRGETMIRFKMASAQVMKLLISPEIFANPAAALAGYQCTPGAAPSSGVTIMWRGKGQAVGWRSIR